MEDLIEITGELESPANLTSPSSSSIKRKLKPHSTPISLTRNQRWYDMDVKMPPQVWEKKIEVKNVEEMNNDEIKEQVSEQVIEKVESNKESKEEKKSKKKEKRSKRPRPDFSSMNNDEQKKARKRYINRFNILKETWKDFDYSDISEDMTLDEMHDAYEAYVQSIHVTRNSDKYKVYMVILWLFIEGACCKFGLPMSGYTKTQLKIMNKYEKLLIKLGEKNYQSYIYDDESPWPVEFDLVIISLINAIAFIILTWLCNNTPMSADTKDNIIAMVSGFLSGEQPQPGQVLFGGQHMSPLPDTSNRGLDVPNLLATFGSMFMPKHQQDEPAKTPKLRPIYDD